MVRKSLLGIVLLAACRPSPPGTLLTGQVVDDQGRPIPQAAIALTDTTLLSDDDGRFSFSGPVTATIAASGFFPTTRRLASPTVISLPARPLRRVVIDLSHQPLGGNGSDFLPLAKVWMQAGFQVDLPARLPDLGDVETLVIAAPKLPYSQSQLASIQQFVRAGGKLLILGEWGGFSDFDPPTLNRLGAPFGITFSHDLIRGPAGSAVEIQSWGDHPVTRGIHRVQLWGATSLQLQAPAKAIGFADGFRVAQSDRPAVVAVALFGAGRVIAIGDCSLFTHVTDGTMPLLEADNRPFAQLLVNW